MSQGPTGQGAFEAWRAGVGLGICSRTHPPVIQRPWVFPAMRLLKGPQIIHRQLGAATVVSPTPLHTAS